MFGILLLLFTIVPALEIFLFIEIGGKIGAFNTFAIVIVTGIVGATLAKSQGLAILQKIQNELNQGALPADQIIHGLLVFGGGLLLLTPGFLTDILGLSMVFPGTRHLLIGLTKEMIDKGMKSGKIHVYTNNNAGFAYEEKRSETNIDNIIEADFSHKPESNQGK